MFRSVTIFCALFGTLLWTPVLPPPFGNWVDTNALAILNGDLYTIEKSGVLKRTNLSTGKVVAVGKADFANTRIMVAASGSLFTIDPGGNLNRINPEDGTSKQVGKAGDWVNTRLATSLNGKIYTIEGSPGSLYEKDPKTGTWKQIGKKRDFRSKYLFPAGSSLYSIEYDGKMYRVDPATGAQVGVE